MKRSDDVCKPTPTYDFGYPTPAHGKIPAFNNIEEEAEFWDTHSFTDFKDQLEPLFPAERASRTEGIPSLFSDIDRLELVRIAQEKGVPPATLIRMWVEERLDQERKVS